jgi:beta-glucosidase
VQLTNTGKVRGDEVVQLYIHEEVNSVTQPIKQLRGFRRLSLDPGESRIVEFTLGPDELSSLDREMRRVVQPGVFHFMVGGNSTELLDSTLNIVP